MGPLLVVALLCGFAAAGPVVRDVGSCAQECQADSKFLYSKNTAYVYSYEASNTLRMEGSSELSTVLKATVEISRISNCEMALQIMDASIRHGSSVDSSSLDVENLKKHPLRFAWNDGKVSHICPHAGENANVNNVKRSILSAFQNSMKTLDHDTIVRETDVLGSCDTEYKIKSHSGVKIMIHKKKVLSSCSEHLKGRSGFIAYPYESPSSAFQHLPFMTGQEYSCHNSIKDGITEEVFCVEKANYKPLSDYGYVVNARGEIKLQLLTSKPAGAIPGGETKGKESLVFSYEPINPENLDSEAVSTLRELCGKTEELLDSDVGLLVHKLVYVIRGLPEDSLTMIYDSLKTKQLCKSPKVKGIFLDSLKAASSEGAVKLLKKLVIDGEMSWAETRLWLAALPFASDPQEGAVEAASHLLEKSVGYQQALLSVSSMAYKYCLHHPDCESSPAIKSVSSKLLGYLNDCQVTPGDQEEEAIFALKGLGNLGYFGQHKDIVFKCASTATNSIPLRVAAMESFRRSPCSEEVSSKLLAFYENENDDDEFRISALVTLSKCISPQIVYRIAKAYSVENSKQVEVFTWSYLRNLQSTNDPMKQKAKLAASRLDLKEPRSSDLTKFSRNFEISRFIGQFNLGYNIEANLIHSRDSFVPRSGNIDLSVDIFGYQLKLLEVGLRVENVEHVLESLFGPRGVVTKELMSNRQGTSAGTTSDSYKARIQSLKDKVGLKHKHPPKGSYYIRILGNELRVRNIDSDTIRNFDDISLQDLLEQYTRYQKIDAGHSFMFFDNTILLPSVTGRAYKLAANGSATLGLQADRKLDLKKLDFPNLLLNLDGRYKPSATIELDATMTIYGESYEPGMKVATTLNTGHDVSLKVDLEKGPAINAKLDFPAENNQLFSMKRVFYEFHEGGERELALPQMHNLQYCTKYLNKVLGLQFCGSMKIPHITNSEGKLSVPFSGPMEASLQVKKTDPSMKGYEISFHLPDTESSTHAFKLLFDTPNSSINRKFAIEVLCKRTDSATSASTKFISPFYKLEVDASYVRQEKQVELKIDALGDGTRRYIVDLHIDKDIKGARLAEYKPTLSITLPRKAPVTFTGTVVFSRGRKEMISFTINSDNVSNFPLSVKGNVAKEGVFRKLGTTLQIATDVTVTSGPRNYKVHGTYTRTGLDVNLDLAVDCSSEEKGPHSVKFNAVLKDVSINNPLSFSMSSEMLTSENPECNFQAKWDFSAKIYEHLKNDIIIRYGNDFQDDERMIQFTQANILSGDFSDFKQLNFENKIGFRLPYINIDKALFLIANWDLTNKPKVYIDIGAKIETDRYTKIEINFESHKRLTERPIKFTSSVQLLFFDYEFKYSTDVQESSPNIIQGREVIQTHPGHQITIDFVYTIRSTDHVFYHEYECTIAAPNLVTPVQHKVYIKSSSNVLEFGSRTDTGNRSPFVIDVKLNSNGPGELSVDLPFLVGKMKIDKQASHTALEADFKTVGRDPRKIVGTGRIVQESDGSAITANINYADSINVDINGKMNRNLLHGPHELRGDFTGNMEPMSIVSVYEFKDGHLNSFVKYLRNSVEKLRLDFNGKFIQQAYHFEVESGLLLTSPYKAFDGKEVYYHLLLESTEASRNFEAEYRLKPGALTGYVGKVSYNRKRGWPGYIKTNALLTIHRRTVFESNAALVYGNGKYSFKTSLMPSPNRKFHLDTTAEVAAKYAAFQHTVSTSLEYLQLIRLNAIADLRNADDYKLQSGIDVNSYKVYDLNATMSMKSITDFDMKAVLLGKLVPSLRVLSKTQNANTLTKYSLSVEKDTVEIMAGKGEIKKRKRGFNGDIAFTYKGKEFLTLNINNEVKSQKERNYVFKLKSFYRTYTIHVNWLKDKKTVKHTVNLCRNEKDSCITFLTSHKDEDGKIERQLTYRRANIELNFERIFEETPASVRRYLVVYSGDKRFGYDIRYGLENKLASFYFGLITPAREMNVESQLFLSSEKPRLTLQLSSDAQRHPDRKLKLDMKLDNQIRTKLPSKLQTVIAHPIFEKPIEIVLVANYDSSKAKVLEAELSLDYSTLPEDKILSKLYVEKVEESATNVNLDVYQEDEQHLAFSVNVKTSCKDGKKGFGMQWLWKDKNDADQSAFVTILHDSKEEKFNLVYHRPKLDFSVDAATAPSKGLHEHLSTIDFVVNYNGETTKAELIRDYSKNCYELHVLGTEGEITRKIESCADLTSPVMFSLKTTSKEENMMVFDYSLEIVRVQFGKLNIRHHWNPEFLGGIVFQLSKLHEELKDAGVGNLPIAESPAYQKMSRSFTVKVSNPLKQFVREEFGKVSNEVVEEAKFLSNKAYEYYESFPTSPLAMMIKRIAKVLKPVFEDALEDAWDRFEDAKEEFSKKFQQFLDRSREFRQRLRARCEEIPECGHLRNAIANGEWNRVLDALRSLISRMPEPFQEYLGNGGKLETWIGEAYEFVMVYVRQLMKTQFVQDAAPVIQRMRLALRERVLEISKRLYGRAVQNVQDIIRSQKVLEFVAQVKKIIGDIRDMDFGGIYKTLTGILEEYLSSAQFFSARQFFKINALDAERGVLNFDLYFPMNLSFLKTFFSQMYASTVKMATIPKDYNWKHLLVKVKRIAEFEFIPPYREEALILGDKHYITFDKTFYDFNGECAYLLASDLEDGNFSLVITPMFTFETDKASGEQDLSLGVFVKDSAVLVNLLQKTVKAGEQVVDLPYLTRDLSVTRDGDVIVIDDYFGVNVKCHITHNLCTATIPGWYYGKTAGLFGTYDYEPTNDFKRPKGQIPHSVTTFAKSWDISKGCKTKNLAPEVKADKTSDAYKVCSDYFEKPTSHLSACFSEVNPEKYFALCYRHVSLHSEKNKALCDVAAAYVIECERNYIELNVAPKCITCEAPDGSLMKHGEKKRYENIDRKSSETVFVIESATCNDRLLSELDSLARAIDRELTNEGYHNNLFGVVVYGSEREPLVYTGQGKMLFDVDEITNTARRIQLTDKSSTSALEAVRLALTYPFRSATSKSIVLMSCSPCNYDYKSLQYPVIQQILLEHEIVLHVINSEGISLKKSASKERNIIGADAETAYTSRDVTQKELIGDPALRSQISLPKDACVALAQDVSGSVFSTHSMGQETKAWRSIFARRLLKTAAISKCRICDCTSTADSVAKVMCRPCESKRPKLPFSVCISCTPLLELAASVFSYILHALVL